MLSLGNDVLELFHFPLQVLILLLQILEIFVENLELLEQLVQIVILLNQLVLVVLLLVKHLLFHLKQFLLQVLQHLVLLRIRCVCLFFFLSREHQTGVHEGIVVQLQIQLIVESPLQFIQSSVLHS